MNFFFASFFNSYFKFSYFLTIRNHEKNEWDSFKTKVEKFIPIPTFSSAKTAYNMTKEGGSKHHRYNLNQYLDPL